MFKKILFIYLLLFSSILAQEVNIYVNSHTNKKLTIEKWQPTIEFLNRSVKDQHFKLLPIRPIDVKKIKELLDNKKIDFLITQPAIFSELKHSYNLKSMLTMVNKHHMSKFGSVFIADKDSDINDIKDIQGRSIIAVAPMGFGGWLIGYNELLKHGIDPLKDKKVSFAGTQIGVIKSIQNKTYEVGVIRTGMLEKLSQKGMIDPKDFKVINNRQGDYPIRISTDLFPEWVFAAAEHVDDGLIHKVFKSISSIEENSEAAKKGEYVHWYLADNYNEVDDIFKKFRLGYYKDIPKYSVQTIIKTIIYISIFFLILFALFRYEIMKSAKNRLVKEVKEKTKTLIRLNAELNLIFDFIPNITILTDGKQLIKINQAFLSFTAYKSLEEFKSKYDCICDLFEERVGFLKRSYDNMTWIEYIKQNPDIEHKALIVKNDKEYIFNVHVQQYSKSNVDKHIVLFDDITEVTTIANSDELTSLPNRKKLDETLQQQLIDYERNKRVFSLIMIDIDWFKSINDKYGHNTGDTVLKELTTILRNNCRKLDTIGRWGGEEFLIICKETDKKGGGVLAESLRLKVESTDFKDIEENITASFGVTEYIADEGIDKTIDRADKALYESKNNGRNKVSII